MTTPAPPVKVSSYVTGHCGNDNHEGSKNLSQKGSLFPACAGTYTYSFGILVTCTCWCHELFKQAKAMQAAALTDVVTGTDKPETAPTVEMNGTSAPTPPVVSVYSGPDVNDFYTKVLEHQDLTLQVYRFVSWHVFKVKGDKSLNDKTTTGRRARGSLDINVEAICRLKFDGFIPNELTPANVAMLIDPIDPPSHGAIHAVFYRWKNAGYCIMSDKPVTMIGFTDRVGKGGITGAKRISERERAARAKGFFA